MSLSLGQEFGSLFNKYFKDNNYEIVKEQVQAKLSKKDPAVLINLFNTVKTSNMIGYSFLDCYVEVLKQIGNICPESIPYAEQEEFILCVILLVLLSNISTELKFFIKVPRDIDREVAAAFFGVAGQEVTEDMITKTKEASDRFTKQSYSIEEPPVENWDEYFYNICKDVARNSKCFSRRIGSVLVREKRILSTGYNGPPVGIPTCDKRWKLDPAFAETYKEFNKDTEGKCPRKIIGFGSGKGLDLCTAGHSERNSLINAARMGHSTKGATLYMSCGIPCKDCLIEIINAGVEEIVVTSLQIYDETSLYILKQSNLKIRLFNFIK